MTYSSSLFNVIIQSASITIILQHSTIIIQNSISRLTDNKICVSISSVETTSTRLYAMPVLQPQVISGTMHYGMYKYMLHVFCDYVRLDVNKWYNVCCRKGVRQCSTCLHIISLKQQPCEYSMNIPRPFKSSTRLQRQTSGLTGVVRNACEELQNKDNILDYYTFMKISCCQFCMPAYLDCPG